MYNRTATTTNYNLPTYFCRLFVVQKNSSNVVPNVYFDSYEGNNCVFYSNAESLPGISPEVSYTEGGNDMYVRGRYYRDVYHVSSLSLLLGVRHRKHTVVALVYIYNIYYVYLL